MSDEVMGREGVVLIALRDALANARHEVAEADEDIQRYTRALERARERKRTAQLNLDELKAALS